MKKSIKTLFFASFSVFLFNCSSDDSASVKGPGPGPEPIVTEKTHYLSAIEQNFYDEDEQANENYLLHVNYKLEYDADFKLSKILYTDTGYTNNEVVREQSLEMHHKLDAQGRLETFTLKNGSTIVEEYTYTYANDLLRSTKYDLVAQGGEFTANFHHNENKQMITNNALGANLLVDYTYNEKNQIDRFKVNGQNIKLSYDDKVSPFYNLPYDLTSLLFNFNYVFPYTYKFPNNVTSFTAANEVADVDYTYNEANLPTKAIYYEGKREDNIVAFDITYTYTVKETEVKQ
ncbi:hypothetical protein [Myroides fluvii]|uniref:hypothetical protein n=1 Tax=Myroides fluvii TaxID=2572594 RepID=UPI00131A930F|nr:hypothetical protein [Myroides fluvii]